MTCGSYTIGEGNSSRRGGSVLKTSCLLSNYHYITPSNQTLQEFSSSLFSNPVCHPEFSSQPLFVILSFLLRHSLTASSYSRCVHYCNFNFPIRTIKLKISCKISPNMMFYLRKGVTLTSLYQLVYSVSSPRTRIFCATGSPLKEYNKFE